MSFKVKAEGKVEDLFVTDAWMIDRYVGDKLYAWGTNSQGLLGDGTVSSKSTPIQISGITWKLSMGGEANSTHVRTDGTIWSSGHNFYGTLGDGTTVHRSSPVQFGTLAGWKQVACGYATIAAINNDGSLWSCGYNEYGNLGDNTAVRKSSPVQTVAGGNDWKQVACGKYTTLALKQNGSLWGWGRNNFGQLGDGTTVHKSSPVQTVAGGTDWSQISCSYHSAAVKTDGTLWMWGYNDFGQLGIGTFEDWKSSPVQVGALNNWKQVACGYRHTMMIKKDGTLWGVGFNDWGQLGTGTNTEHRSSPIQIGTLTDWKQVSCGYLFTAAVKKDGTLWTWGRGAAGQLGIGSVTDRSSPVQVGTFTNWKWVGCGFNHVVAVTNGS